MNRDMEEIQCEQLWLQWGERRERGQAVAERGEAGQPHNRREEQVYVYCMVYFSNVCFLFEGSGYISARNNTGLGKCFFYIIDRRSDYIWLIDTVGLGY